MAYIYPYSCVLWYTFTPILYTMLHIYQYCFRGGPFSDVTVNYTIIIMSHDM